MKAQAQLSWKSRALLAIEASGRRKDASSFPMELSCGQMHEVTGYRFIATIHDITERKQNEQALRQARDGRLDATRICEAVPDWEDADFWFCGPAAFGDTLSKDLISKGLPAQDFHQELFEMR